MKIRRFFKQNGIDESNLRVDFEEKSDLIDCKLFDGEDFIGYIKVVPRNMFLQWNRHYELEMDLIESKSLHIIGISIINRGKGYGKYLVDYIEQYAIDQNMEYVTLNSITSSLGFWKKLDYEVYAIGDYYGMFKKVC